MRNCPHCKFLVGDDATTCSVCHGDLAAPVAAGVPHQAFAAPGQVSGVPTSPQSSFTAVPYGQPGATVPPLPGAAWPLPPPGAPVPPNGLGPPPNRGASTAKVLVIVGLVCLIPVLGVAALFLLGTTAEQQFTRVDLTADELAWTTHEDPGGWYVLDMPGQVDVDTVELPEGYAMPATAETASVSNAEFAASITRSPDMVPDGQTFESLPFSPTAAERAVSEAGFLDDAKIVHDEVVADSGGLELAFELTGTVNGEPSMMRSRLVMVGSDLYELNVVGPRGDDAELAAILERMASSFRAN